MTLHFSVMEIRIDMQPINDEQKKTLSKLDDCICECFYYISIYSDIFGKDTLAKKLDDFDGTLHYIMFNLVPEKIIMGICKILDPPKSAGISNLSLEAVINDFKECIPEDFFNELFEELKTMQFKATKLKDIRNKILSHNDKGLHLKTNIIEGTNIKEIEATLDVISIWMTKFQKKVIDTETLYREGLYKFDAKWFEKMLDWGLEGKANFDRLN